MENPTRRDALALFGATAAAATIPQYAGAQTMKTPSTEVRASLTGGREPRPLPFDPAKLTGLSEKLMRSHWENNYIGSVRALNMIAERLAAAMREPDFPPLVYGGLKREELHRVGSVILHENYFANLGGDGMPGGAVLASLEAAYGTDEAWENEFRRTAMSLAGGSGWCVLAYNLHTHELRNQWAWGPHARRRVRCSAARARHVRALLPHGLRCRRGQVRRCFHEEREVGGGRTAIGPGRRDVTKMSHRSDGVVWRARCGPELSSPIGTDQLARLPSVRAGFDSRQARAADSVLRRHA